MNRSDAGMLGYLKNKEAMDDCRRRQKEEALRKYHELKKKCLNCEKTLPYEKRDNKFCNHSCAAIYNGKRREGKSKKQKCLFCGELTSNAKYCKIKCQQDYQWDRWKKAVFSKGYFIGLHGNSECRRAKKFLLEIRGRKCEICKTVNWMGKPVPLVFDHIDGDSSNWLLDNCRLVCGNCDMQLPTYKSKNKSSARTKRYKHP